jgi:hypothetical protein
MHKTRDSRIRLALNQEVPTRMVAQLPHLCPRGAAVDWQVWLTLLRRAQRG